MKKGCRVCGKIRATLGPTIVAAIDRVLVRRDKRRRDVRQAAKLEKRAKKSARQAAGVPADIQ